MSNVEKLRNRFRTPDARLQVNAAYVCASVVPEIAARIKELYPNLDTEAMERLDPEFYSPLINYFINSVHQLQQDHVPNPTQNSIDLNSFLSDDTLIKYGESDGNITGSTD